MITKEQAKVMVTKVRKLQEAANLSDEHGLKLDAERLRDEAEEIVGLAWYEVGEMLDEGDDITGETYRTLKGVTALSNNPALAGL